MSSKGIILFNRGDRMMVRALVTLFSIRKHYDGDITFYIENPCPCLNEFEDAIKYFNVNVVRLPEKHEYKTLIRKTTLFGSEGFCNYDRTLWLDIDVIVLKPLDELFDMLDEADMVIPHFAGWISNGRAISKRIKRFEGLTEQRYIDEALNSHPAINTGVVAFANSPKWRNFVDNVWVPLSDKASKKGIFISDEVGMQILMPNVQEWDLKYSLAPTGYNVSVLHDHGKSLDKYIMHYHGDKHVLPGVESCNIWKSHFHEMVFNNIANINFFLKYADKRLAQYLKGEKTDVAVDEYEEEDTMPKNDVTIVTACDEKYVDFLRITFPNWRKYKNIDNYPVIVFVHGIDIEDARLDFLKLPNVKIIPWSMDNVDNHREEMLSAFVFGAAENVKTDYWLKLDADSYATDSRPLFDESMKQYAFCGHKWHYSRPEHIKTLDEWAKGHWRPKLKKAKPMIEEGKIEGRRFYHNTRRTISFIQLHKTKFTKFCVGLCRERRLPAPTQDTFMFFVCNRFDPHMVGTANFKKNHGFTQGNSKGGAEELQKHVENVDIINVKGTE